MMNKRYNKARLYKNPRIITASRKKARKDNNIMVFFKRLFRLAILVLFLFLLNYLFSNDYLRIKNINQTGDITFEQKILEVTEKKLNENKLLIFKNSNYFLFKSDNLVKDIKSEIPEIKDITIKKKFPDKLEIKVSERKASIGWQTDDKKYSLDEDGFILKEIDNFDGLLYIKDLSNLPINQSDRVVYQNFIQFVKDVYKKLNETDIKIDHMEIKETTFVLTVVSNKGLNIIFDTTSSLTEQFSKLQQAKTSIGQDLSRVLYIDLTVKNKAIYKFK